MGRPGEQWVETKKQMQWFGPDLCCWGGEAWDGEGGLGPYMARILVPVN